MKPFRFPCSTNAKDHKYKWTTAIIWPKIAFDYVYLILNHSPFRSFFTLSSQCCWLLFHIKFCATQRTTKITKSRFLPLSLFSSSNVIFWNIMRAKWKDEDSTLVHGFWIWMLSSPYTCLKASQFRLAISFRNPGRFGIHFTSQIKVEFAGICL